MSMTTAGHARTSDPSTSKAAVPGESVLSYLHYLALIQFEQAGEQGLTADEVEVESRRKGIWRRCSDIKEPEYIVPALDASGEVRTRLGRSGKAGEVFKITKAGIEALEQAKKSPPKPTRYKRSQSKDQRILDLVEEYPPIQDRGGRSMTAETDRLRKRPNWTWARLRLTVWRCRHNWMVGDRTTGAKACAKCGVWRWFPITTRYGRAWR